MTAPIRIDPIKTDVIVIQGFETFSPGRGPRSDVIVIQIGHPDSRESPQIIRIQMQDLPALPYRAATRLGQVIKIQPFLDLDEMARGMLGIINQDRADQEPEDRKLRPLHWHDGLARVARAHSEDMIAKHYMGHTNQEGLGPADRVARAGIRYWICGENIAGSPTIQGNSNDPQREVVYTGYPSVKQAETGLMNSPHHRDNLLHPDFTHVGVGIACNPDGTLVITQNFLG